MNAHPLPIQSRLSWLAALALWSAGLPLLAQAQDETSDATDSPSTPAEASGSDSAADGSPSEAGTAETANASATGDTSPASESPTGTDSAPADAADSANATEETLPETEVTGARSAPVRTAPPPAPAPAPPAPVEVPEEPLPEPAIEPVTGYKVDDSWTATKMDVPIIDVPTSVQVVPEEVIEDQNATRLWEAVRNVSGVQNSGSAGNRSDGFVIRGFDAGRLLHDGFPAPVSFGDVGFIGMSTLERVEVLKGPASILYGLVEPGGTINLVTKKPQLDPFYRSSFTYGSHDFYRPEFDVNQPLTEDGTLLFRVAGEYQNAGSFRDVFTRDKRKHIAPSLRWLATPDTTVDLQLTYYEQENPADRGIVVIDDRPDALPRHRYHGEPFDINYADKLLGKVTIEHRFDDDWTWRTMASGSGSNTRPLASYPFGLLEGSDRLIERGNYDFIQEIDNYAFQSNLTGHFDTGAIGHEVLVGIDANSTRFESWNRSASMQPIDAFNPVYGKPFGAWSPRSHQDRRYDFYGLYLQDLMSFGDHWKLMLGGRYDYMTSFFARDGAVSLDSTEKEISPRAGLVYQPVEDLSLYASYTESFSPSLFSSNFGNIPFDPEYGEQVEIGVKRDWFDGALSTTLAAYELTKTNLTTPDPNNPLFEIQTGEQRSRGVEFDISGEILPGWKVFGGLAYMDAELTSDNTFPVGNRLPNAPEWSGSLWTTYAFEHGPLSGLEIGGGVFGVGERFGSLNNRVLADGYARVDAFARYQVNENLRVSLNVDNLFDKDYIEAPGSTVSVPGSPREAFLTIGLSY